MYVGASNSIPRRAALLLCMFLTLAIAAPPAAGAGKKKSAPAPVQQEKSWYEQLNMSEFAWPQPPAVSRLKYLDYFCCQKEELQTVTKKKTSWMDRMAGGESEGDKQTFHPRFGLWTPYGMAVDSKGRLYVADGRVGAIFIFNTETKELELIKHGVNASFGTVMGLAMDDNDRLFVSDSKFRHVLVFDSKHKLEATISGMSDPCGLALDAENRFLYVVDTGLDQVLVYDADSLKLLRKIGTTGKNHTLSNPGDFAKPTNAAVDKDGNLFVTDTLNNRVEEFDADGSFIGEFGKAGDGPGKFSRPKGIAVDSDGFVWVADAMQDTLQTFTADGRLLLWIGGHGKLPGHFNNIAGVTIDKQNRVFTTEQYMARVQMFRYVTQEEARAEYARRDAGKKKAEELKSTSPDSKETTAEKPKGSGAL